MSLHCWNYCEGQNHYGGKFSEFEHRISHVAPVASLIKSPFGIQRMTWQYSDRSALKLEEFGTLLMSAHAGTTEQEPVDLPISCLHSCAHAFATAGTGATLTVGSGGIASS